MRKYIAIIIASLALFTGQAHAQRCLPKMQGIEVRANMADGFNPGGKNGGRHQSFVIENEDLVRANTINELQVR